MKKDSIYVVWRVQVRKSRAHKWVNKGTFETRSAARNKAAMWRYGYMDPYMGLFGNTRVVRVERGGK